MLRYFILISFTLVSLGLLNGCTSLSSFQTARTLAPKTGRVSIGVGYLLTPENQRPAGVSSLGTTFGELPLMDLAFRTGLQKYLDLGFKLSFPGTLTIDGKYQFIDHQTFAVATGAGFSYVALASTLINENKGIRSNFLDLFIPLFLGADFSKVFGITFSPHVVIRKNTSASTPLHKLMGATFGIRVGDKKGLFLEGSYLWDMDTKSNAIQVNVAFFFGNASSVPNYDLKPIEHVPQMHTSPRKEGNLIAFFPRTKSILISHPSVGIWRATDRICILEQLKPIACGTIIKVRKGSATAKLNFIKKKPSKGALVILEESL